MSDKQQVPSPDEQRSAWDHFCDTVELEQPERDLLQKNKVTSVERFYVFFKQSQQSKNIYFRQFEKGGTAELFGFDESNVISMLSQGQLSHAWLWLDEHKGVIGDAKAFCDGFHSSFAVEVIRLDDSRKREREDEDERSRKKLQGDLVTKASRMAASAFTSDSKHLLEGVGTSPPRPFQHLIPAHVRERFVKLVQQCKQSAASTAASGSGESGTGLERIACFLRVRYDGYRLNSMGETRDCRPVQKEVLDALVNTGVFSKRVTTERVHHDSLLVGKKARTLKDLDLGDGVATLGSVPDGFFHTRPLQLKDRAVDFLVAGVIECKGSESSVFRGAGEATALASNAAVAMFKVGLPIDQIVIPVVSLTGAQFQFAAVYLLEPCFPVVCFLTDALRCTVKDDCETIAAYLCAMRDFTIKLEEYVNGTDKTTGLVRRDSAKMQLSSEKYYFKRMSRFFRCHNNDPSFEKSVNHFLGVTEKLAGLKAVCLPLTIRLGETKGGETSEDIIVFDMLAGYNMGFPDEEEDRKSLLEAMRAAVSAVHGRGVIHMDLYLSNMMWKKGDDGSFDVKLIDFDAAQLRGDSSMTDAVVQRLEDYESDLIEKFGKAPSEEYDQIYLAMFTESIDDALLRVAQNDGEEQAELLKGRLDDRCKQLKEEFVSQYETKNGEKAETAETTT